MSIGSRIKEKRESIGMTQEELAAELGVSKGAIGNYESGNSYPKIDNMIQLFKALKTDANYIFQDETVQKEMMLSSKEQTVIKKYRKLDDYGVDAVDGVLDVEYIRCTNPVPLQSQSHTWTICYSEYKASAGTGVMLDSYERMERLDVLDTLAARRRYCAGRTSRFCGSRRSRYLRGRRRRLYQEIRRRLLDLSERRLRSDPSA